MMKFLVVILISIASFAHAEERSYTFPNKAYTITFPCLGLLDEKTTYFYEYTAYTANIQCNQIGVTYSVVYHEYKNLDGIDSATEEDKYYFLRQFRDMVREGYAGDTEGFDLKDEKPTTIGNKTAIRYTLSGNTMNTGKLKVESAVMLDGMNALYLSSSFVKDLEIQKDFENFLNSIKAGKR
jgi:hypothetical protein